MFHVVLECNFGLIIISVIVLEIPAKMFIELYIVTLNEDRECC